MTDPKDQVEKPRRLTREEARHQTRERLLDAAAVVFNQHGYNGASLDAVADAAGYTKGAVYSNFATKADLFIALLDRFIEQEAAAQAVQFQTGTIADFIDALDRTLAHQTRENPQWVLLQMEFWLAATRDPVIRAKVPQGLRVDARSERQDPGRASWRRSASRRPSPAASWASCSTPSGVGLALNFYLEPEALDPKLFVRASRLLFGLDPTSGTSGRPGPSRFRRPGSD